LYHANGEGHVRSSDGGDVHEGASRREEYGAVAGHGGASSSFECSFLLGSSIGDSTSTVARGV